MKQNKTTSIMKQFTNKNHNAMKKLKTQAGMKKEFTIQTYTKKELALMYFPYSSPRIAVNHLRSWLTRCKPLNEALKAMDYRPGCKYFTPRQVKAIVEQLGEP